MSTPSSNARNCSLPRFTENHSCLCCNEHQAPSLLVNTADKQRDSDRRVVQILVEGGHASGARFHRELRSCDKAKIYLDDVQGAELMNCSRTEQNDWFERRKCEGKASSFCITRFASRLAQTTRACYGCFGCPLRMRHAAFCSPPKIIAAIAT